MHPQIFLIDDDELISRTISLLLRGSGYDVCEFRNAERALAALRETVAAADGAKPGLVLLDLEMPGMNGVHFLRELMKMNCTVPTVILSGHAETLSERDLVQRCSGVLNKPFTRAELLEKVSEIFGAGSPGA